VVILVAHLLNFALAMVFWATLGRILLNRMMGGGENFFLGVLRKATDPAYALVGRVVPQQFVPIGVLVLVVAARLALLPLLREP
jgi:uncharacterized protein YggT (Ycf19 family)